jgi:uncharacterized membrane protein YhaH (DUF805 family)
VIGAAALWILACVVAAITFLGELLISIVGLFLLLPMAGVAARRLQDTGKPGSTVWIAILPIGASMILTLLISLGAWGPFYFLGFWLLYPLMRLLSLAALIATIYIGYLCAQPGVAGENEYGPQPAKPVAPAPAT